MSVALFAWSHGRSRYDVHPLQHTGALRALATFCSHHRSERKGSA